jgi:Mn-dependent DtxR family transcriptional regulator
MQHRPAHEQKAWRTDGGSMGVVERRHGTRTELTFGLRVARHGGRQQRLLANTLMSILGPNKPQANVRQAEEVVMQRLKHLPRLGHLLNCTL